MLSCRLRHVNLCSQGVLYRGVGGTAKSPMRHVVPDNWKDSGFGAADDAGAQLPGLLWRPSYPIVLYHCSSPS